MQQTIQWDQWLVVNDGKEEYQYTMGQEVVRRDPCMDTLPSICHNWLAALPRIRGDKVIVVEDDDYYHPQHVSVLDSMLDSVQLAGVSHDVYFKLPTRRFMRMGNENHASLAATGWRSEINAQVERTVTVFRSVFIDMYLWVEAGPVWPCTKRLVRQPVDRGRMLHVGMKNMPGAKGLGVGHESPESGSHDPNFSVLAEWIGPEPARIYRKVWQDYYGSKL